MKFFFPGSAHITDLSQTRFKLFSSVRFKGLLVEHVTRDSYTGPHELAIAVTCQIVWLNDRMSEWIT